MASLPLGKRPSTHGIGGWSNEVGPWNAQKVSKHVVTTVITNKYNIFRKCPCCITFPILHVFYFIIKVTPLSELILILNCVLTRKNAAEFKGLGSQDAHSLFPLRLVFKESNSIVQKELYFSSNCESVNVVYGVWELLTYALCGSLLLTKAFSPQLLIHFYYDCCLHPG